MITNIFTIVVALLHFYFLILEMFYWTKPKGLKIFRQTQENAKISAKLAANQGLYNGFLAAGLIWAVIENDSLLATKLKIFFLACVIIAGAYGARTVNKRIFFVQALPALIAIICLAAGI